jgi:RimJ/RimL family protein N-acetyltransferase
MNTYKVLSKQVFTSGGFSIVPIRFEDRYDIMKWRNEQIYHLRQTVPLTKEDQDAYFGNVVFKLFEEEEPSQILFSLIENEICIGYGGLVHINWENKNAEISFIINTNLEKDRFHEIWLAYLRLIEELAFGVLIFHKIYTFAFDVRPNLYEVFHQSHFIEEARLKQHVIFKGNLIDVLIHSKINNRKVLVPICENDIEITYHWASDVKVRQFSFNNEYISFEEHKHWFLNKLKDSNCYYYIMQQGAQKVGSIRIDFNDLNQQGVVSYLIGSESHGKGYGTCILQMAEDVLRSFFEEIHLIGLVMKSNDVSIRIFNKLGYDLISEQEDILTFSKILYK